jgi:hypothetical protein
MPMAAGDGWPRGAPSVSSAPAPTPRRPSTSAAPASPGRSAGP